MNNYCKVCIKKFNNRSTFLCHLASNHRGPFPLANATKNVDVHAYKKPIDTIPIILNGCNSESTLTDECSNKDHRYQCSICQKKFSFNSLYVRHISTHMPGKYLCSYCPKVFKRNDTLVKHTKHIHLGNLTVNKCNTCSKRFKYKSSLKEHIINSHFVKKQKHICKICKQGLSSKKTLQYHLNAHHNKQGFRCGVCGLTFIAPYKKSRHSKTHVIMNH